MKKVQADLIRIIEFKTEEGQTIWHVVCKENDQIETCWVNENEMQNCKLMIEEYSMTGTNVACTDRSKRGLQPKVWIQTRDSEKDVKNVEEMLSGWKQKSTARKTSNKNKIASSLKSEGKDAKMSSNSLKSDKVNQNLQEMRAYREEAAMPKLPKDDLNEGVWFAKMQQKCAEKKKLEISFESSVRSESSSSSSSVKSSVHLKEESKSEAYKINNDSSSSEKDAYIEKEHKVESIKREDIEPKFFIEPKEMDKNKSKFSEDAFKTPLKIRSEESSKSEWVRSDDLTVEEVVLTFLEDFETIKELIFLIENDENCLAQRKKLNVLLVNEVGVFNQIQLNQNAVKFTKVDEAVKFEGKLLILVTFYFLDEKKSGLFDFTDVAAKDLSLIVEFVKKREFELSEEIKKLKRKANDRFEEIKNRVSTGKLTEQYADKNVVKLEKVLKLAGREEEILLY